MKPVNRAKYFDFIEERLSFLATRIEIRGGLNILDLHLHSENFYLNLFNLIFNWSLINLNTCQRNIAGIDLVDESNKIVVQVSATATKQKIESSLAKEIANYKGYFFKFISISKDTKSLKNKDYLNPHELIFHPSSDIFDISDILSLIIAMDVDKQKEIYEFLKKELRNDVNPDRVESNVAAIIKILSNEDWSQDHQPFEVIPYDIEEKISYNQLSSARLLIDDYKVHYFRVDSIYCEFNKQGVNKSISVLNGIRTMYLTLGVCPSPDDCFFIVIEKVIAKIQASANYVEISEEELELCVQILVVDAFIRCKIFKNPLGGM
jgi:hypothetical protein